MDTGSHRRRGAWAVLAVLAIVLVAGCGGAASSSRELSLALAEEPDELDPTISSSFVSRMVFAHMCEKLYDVDGELGLVPQLAAALPQVSRDGKTVTIRLREGIRFNDGTPFDAAAVKQSLDRHRTLETSSRSGELAPVTAGRGRRSAHRPPLAGDAVPAADLAAGRPRRDDHVAGGARPARREVRHRPGVRRAVLVRRADRLGPDRAREARPSTTTADKVQLDRIVFRIITDGPVRASNLRSGDIDVAERLEPVDVVSIRNDASIDLREVVSLGYQGISLNVGNADGIGKPFKTVDMPLARKPELRRAFELSLDREVINRVVFFDQYVPGCSPISPSSRWADEALRCPGRDLDEAKRLIAQSGVKPPVPVELMLEAGGESARLGEVVQAMAAEAGFEVKLPPTEFTTALDNGDAGDFDAFQVGWSGRVDPDGNIYNQQASDGPTNYAGAADATVDDAINAARTERDPAKRRELYRELVGAAQRAQEHPLPLPPAPLPGRAPGHRAASSSAPDGIPRLAFASVELMGGYLLRRIGASLIVLLIASVVIFVGVRALPGDPALALAGEDRSPQALAAVRDKYGLDDPVPVQYVRWLGQVVQGDLGTSVRTGLDVRDTIVDRLPITLELAFLEPARRARDRDRRGGDLAAVRRGTLADYGGSLVALIGLSIPNFWLGLVLILIFADRARRAAGLRLRAVLRGPARATCSR